MRFVILKVRNQLLFTVSKEPLYIIARSLGSWDCQPGSINLEDMAIDIMTEVIIRDNESSSINMGFNNSLLH